MRSPAGGSTVSRIGGGRRRALSRRCVSCAPTSPGEPASREVAHRRFQKFGQDQGVLEREGRTLSHVRGEGVRRVPDQHLAGAREVDRLDLLDRSEVRVRPGGRQAGTGSVKSAKSSRPAPVSRWARSMMSKGRLRARRARATPRPAIPAPTIKIDGGIDTWLPVRATGSAGRRPRHAKLGVRDR